MTTKLPSLPTTFPSIRETHYGQTLGIRSKFQESVGLDYILGPPDLIHWGKYCGSRSTQFLHNDFTKDKIKHEGSKDGDGYIGNYHYVNGLNLEKTIQDIEDYILAYVGIEKENDNYYFKKSTLSSERFFPSKREMVLTYCTYNAFNKSDFRTRFVIHMNGSLRRTPVLIDKSYQVIPNPHQIDQKPRKTFAFNSLTISELSTQFWEELKGSQIVRLFSQLDDPSSQLVGLVSYSSFVESKKDLLSSISILVGLLNKGFQTGSKIAYGLASSCGSKGDSTKKTSQYRNNLIDTIIRLCQIDLSGYTSEFAINEIKKSHTQPSEWDYVVLKIYKIQRGSSMEKGFVELIYHHFKTNQVYSTQGGLILLEQLKFLLSKEKYSAALIIAQKCVSILLLDFESWYMLALCYILNQDYQRALSVINSLPLINHKNMGSETVSGVKDLFASTFVHRTNQNEEGISENTFNSFFPLPSEGEHPTGSIDKLWTKHFIFSPHLRHPFVGNHFYQSPLVNCSPKESASVDPNFFKVCGPSSGRNILASQSLGSSSISILDFNQTSTWGRCYDLLSFFVAIVGWDQIVRLKEVVFSSNQDASQDEYVVDHSQGKMNVACENWLEQLFLVIYDDLKTLMVIANHDKEQHHSAMEWEMIGLLGWHVKYNLKESISSLITSVLGAGNEGGFDFFGIVQLLEIYDEFILSDTIDSNIDLFHDDYDLRFFSNKLILKLSSPFYKTFTKNLEEDYLTLEFILLNLMKLISWNLRWYQNIPNYLIIKVLTKLIIKYDLIYIRTKLRVVFEKNKAETVKKAGFSFSTFLGGSTPAEVEEVEFAEGDSIFEYMETLIEWIEGLHE